MASASPVPADLIPDIAHNAAEIYRLGVESSPTGLLMVNMNGEMTMVNRQVEAMFGYGRSDLLGQRVEMLIPPRFRAQHPHLMRGFLVNPKARAMGHGRDLFGLRRDGSEFPIEIGLNPSGDVVLASIVDISERKVHEEELRSRVEELQRYQTEMRLLSEMTSLLQHAAVPSEAYDIVRSFGEDLIPRLREGAGLAVYAVGAQGGTLERQVLLGSAGAPDRIERGECWALRRSQPHFVPEHGRREASGPAFPRCAHAAPTGWHLCVPMAAHGQSIGLVSLTGETTFSTTIHREFERVGRAVADQLALAISNLNLRESLRSLAIRDPLTGLFNRRYMDEVMVREIQRARRLKSRVSVLMIDVDMLKQLNDTHGHQTADLALAYVGKVIQSNLRDSDMSCRYGGDEFVVMLPDCAKQDAVKHADRLCELMQPNDFGVTISAGVAELPSDGHVFEVIMRRADAALYEAKSAGRNRVRAARTTKPPTADDKAS